MMRSLLPLFAATAFARGQGDVTPWSCAGKSQVPEDSNGKVNSSVLFQAFPEPALVPWPAQLDIEADYLALSNVCYHRKALSCEGGAGGGGGTAQCLPGCSPATCGL